VINSSLYEKCKGNKSCNAKRDEIQDIKQRSIIKLGDDSLSSDDSTNEATDDHDDNGSDENDKDARLD
jgi:hypothetical protein